MVASAVSLGLDWLARHQSPDGKWDALRFSSRCRGACTGPGNNAYDEALTGLACCAFLHRVGSGENVPQSESLTAGLGWLVGAWSRPRPADANPYATAIGALAVVEAFSRTRDERYRAPAQRAVDALAAAQKPSGCFFDSMSQTAWCVRALGPARAAGLQVRGETIERARAFLHDMTDADGWVGYKGPPSTDRPKDRPWLLHPSMTAAGLVSRAALGEGSSAADRPVEARRSLSLILADLPRWEAEGESPIDYYYWHLGTEAVAAYGDGAETSGWCQALQSTLCEHQCGQEPPCRVGSWESTGVDPWSDSGGRVYATALNVLTLEASLACIATTTGRGEVAPSVNGATPPSVR
jgi:hypothetical protein